MGVFFAFRCYQKNIERVWKDKARGGVILPLPPTGIGIKQISVNANLKLRQTSSGNV